MQRIIDTLKIKNIPLSQLDIQIYYEFYQHFTSSGAKDYYATLFANISFLFTNRALVDHLLGYLDADIRKAWQAEAGLSLNTPQQYVSYFGLSWPLPIPELATNKSNHLLSRVLFAMEKRHGINIDEKGDVNIPTFVGYIIEKHALSILEKRQLWNEEPKLSALFFHGKMTHRIQFNLLLRALELKMLDIGDLTVYQLLDTMINYTLAYNKINKPWEFLLDFVVSASNVKPNTDMQHLQKLLQRYPAVTGENKSDYIYACDPYFFHSYLMTGSRENTPHLSECVTQGFVKSALGIQRLEKQLGRYLVLNDYHICKQPANDVVCALTDDDLMMQKVLQRQAFVFAVASVHLLTQDHVINDQLAKGKLINHSKTLATPYGAVQYRFFAAARQEVVDDMKRRKVI